MFWRLAEELLATALHVFGPLIFCTNNRADQWPRTPSDTQGKIQVKD